MKISEMDRSGFIGFAVGMLVMWLSIHFQTKARFEFHTETMEFEGVKEPVIYRCDLLTGATQMAHYHSGQFVPVNEPPVDPHPL